MQKIPTLSDRCFLPLGHLVISDSVSAFTSMTGTKKARGRHWPGSEWQTSALPRGVSVGSDAQSGGDVTKGHTGTLLSHAQVLNQTEFRGLLGYWSLISSQGDSHLWPFGQTASPLSIHLWSSLTLDSLPILQAGEHSLLIYWSMSACGGSREETLCALTASHMDFFLLSFLLFIKAC